MAGQVGMAGNFVVVVVEAGKYAVVGRVVMGIALVRNLLGMVEVLAVVVRKTRAQSSLVVHWVDFAHQTMMVVDNRVVRAVVVKSLETVVVVVVSELQMVVGLIVVVLVLRMLAGLWVGMGSILVGILLLEGFAQTVTVVQLGVVVVLGLASRRDYCKHWVVVRLPQEQNWHQMVSSLL